MLRRLAEATSLTCLQGGNLENKHRTKDLWIKWSYCKVCRGVTLQHTNYCALSHMGILCARWGCSSARHLSCSNSCQKGQSHSSGPVFPLFLQPFKLCGLILSIAQLWHSFDPSVSQWSLLSQQKNCWLFCGVSLLLAQWAESAHSAVRGAVVSPLKGSPAACRLGGSEWEEIEGWTEQGHPF